MQVLRFPFQAMAATNEVVLAAADAATARAHASVAIDEVARIERKYSRYRADSIVSRINAGAGGRDAVACDDETWSLFEHAHALYEHSGGLFDITSGVLRRVWDFKAAQLPDEAALAALLPLIDWPRVQRHERSVRLPLPGMEIDFGGFGKEYAADRAGALLAQRGVAHGYVNLAGDMRVIGPRPDGQPWRIGIQHPRRRGELVAHLPVAQGGLATSGDYERFFEADGRRYCHVLNPRSGWPVSYWQSISVLAPLTVMAGNCSTIAMLMEAQGLAFLEAAGVSYLAIDATGTMHMKSVEPTATRIAASA